MTYEEDYNIPEEIMEQICEQGFDALPELISNGSWHLHQMVKLVLILPHGVFSYTEYFAPFHNCHWISDPVTIMPLLWL